MDDCLEKIENRPILSRDNIEDNKLCLVPASLFSLKKKVIYDLRFGFVNQMNMIFDFISYKSNHVFLNF